MMKRILWIDDDEVLNMIFKQIMQNYYNHIQYSSFTEGTVALDYLEKSQINREFPDIIFVDLKMPEIDGFEFLEKYSDKFYSNFPETKIYVLTSSIRTSEIEQANSYKCVEDCITKPISIEKLGELLQ